MKKLFRQQSGSGLVMVLMATMGIVGLSYLVASRAKINTVVGIKSVADRDLEDATMRIGSLFLQPSHCNANFYFKDFTTTTLTGTIKSCQNGADCRTNKTYSQAIPILSPTSDMWSTAQTGLTERVRVVGVNFSVKTPQTPESGNPLNKRAAVLGITVTFQKNLGMVNGTRNVISVKKDFEAFVVTHIWNNITNALDPSPDGKYIGCAWTPNSTYPYTF